MKIEALDSNPWSRGLSGDGIVNGNTLLEVRPRRLNPLMLLALSGIAPGVLAMPFLFQELRKQDPRWSWEDIEAFELLGTRGQRRAVQDHLQGIQSSAAPKPPRERRKSRSCEARLRKRRFSPGLRYVRRHSIDPFLDGRLSKGACRTLVYLIARCGKLKKFRAATCWVAEDLTVTTRTIQNHYRALEAAGYLVRSAPDKARQTTICLTPLCEPPTAAKKLPRVSRELHGLRAKQNSHTQPIKGKKEEERKVQSGDVRSGQVNVGETPPENPGAAPTHSPQPLNFPLVEEVNPNPLRDRERRQRSADRPGRVSGTPDAPTQLDAAMDRILKDLNAAYRARGGSGPS